MSPDPTHQKTAEREDAPMSGKADSLHAPTCVGETDLREPHILFDLCSCTCSDCSDEEGYCICPDCSQEVCDERPVNA